MEEQQRFENAQSVSKDIQHSTTEPINPEDLYNPIDLREKETKSSTGERVRGWIETGKSKVQQFNERYPTASKYAGKATRLAVVIRAQTPLGKAGAFAVSKAPEAYQYGKQIWHYVEEAKVLKVAEERAAKGKAFHELAEKARGHEVAKLKQDLDFAHRTGKDQKVDLVDAVRHTNQKEIDIIYDKLHSAEYSHSLEEVLSKNAGNYNFTTRLDRSRAIAQDYRQAMMNGSAKDKYDYLLDEARRELGDRHFDIAKYPDRATKFDAFAAKRLYEDGASKEVVKKTIEEGAFYPSLPQKTSHAWEYGERTYGAISRESDGVRQQVLNWQTEQAKNLAGAKINPEELPKLAQLKDHARAYEISKTKEVRELAQNTLERYKADGDRWEKITTKEEYLIEMGRRIEAGRTPSDRSVANKLMLAGHEDKHIVGALQEYSPKMNNSQMLSSKFLEELKLENQQNPQYKQVLQEAVDFREKNSISHLETRLDRLNLSYEQREANLNYNTFENTTQKVIDGTSGSRRDISNPTQNHSTARTESSHSSGQDRSEIDR